MELHVPSQCFGKLVRGETYPLDAGVPMSRQINGQLQASENMIDAATNTFQSIDWSEAGFGDVVSVTDDEPYLPSRQSILPTAIVPDDQQPASASTASVE